MQGISFFQYKCLIDYLNKLQDQAELLSLSAEHCSIISQYKEKLKEVYREYEITLNKVALIVTQYKEQQMAIRRLIVQHKRNKAKIKKVPAHYDC